MDIIQKMADHFDTEKLALKVAEECSELTEVLIKIVTKSERFKPPLDKVIEEMGDVWFRSEILMRKLGIRDQVMQRFHEKGANVAKWYDANKW